MFWTREKRIDSFSRNTSGILGSSANNLLVMVTRKFSEQRSYSIMRSDCSAILPCTTFHLQYIWNHQRKENYPSLTKRISNRMNVSYITPFTQNPNRHSKNVRIRPSNRVKIKPLDPRGKEPLLKTHCLFPIPCYCSNRCEVHSLELAARREKTKAIHDTILKRELEQQLSKPELPRAEWEVEEREIVNERNSRPFRFVHYRFPIP